MFSGRGEPPSRPLRDTLTWVIRRAGLRVPAPVFHAGEQPEWVSADAPPASADTRHLALAARATAVLAALALFYTLYLARAVVLPVVVSILLSFLLRGPVRWLKKHRVPDAFGASIVVFGGVVAVVVSLSLLSSPARSWMERAPSALVGVERKVRAFTAPVLKWEATAARMEQLASGGPGRATAAAPPVAPRTGIMRRAFGGVANLLVACLSVVFLTYFLLASGDLFMRKLMKVMPIGTERSGMPQRVSDDVETAVGTYLRTTVLINAGLGLATWGLLWSLGMPNAGLWGSVAGLLNFVPYLGALLTTAVLAVAAFAVFDTPGRALLVPSAFLALNMIESNGVTPLLMGRQFPLNAVALFVGVLFWGSVWGIPGAILAVPMMVTLKILSDAIPALRPLGEFLGQ